jgi:dTMP kinase
VVLLDRFYDSTFAYQGYGHGLDLATLRIITEFATGGLTPDLTLFLDLSPELPSTVAMLLRYSVKSSTAWMLCMLSFVSAW